MKSLSMHPPGCLLMYSAVPEQDLIFSRACTQSCQMLSSDRLER